jgi:hypothetical protein
MKSRGSQHFTLMGSRTESRVPAHASNGVAKRKWLKTGVWPVPYTGRLAPILAGNYPVRDRNRFGVIINYQNMVPELIPSWVRPIMLPAELGIDNSFTCSSYNVVTLCSSGSDLNIPETGKGCVRLCLFQGAGTRLSYLTCESR